MSVTKCADCGVDASTVDRLVLLVQSVTVNGKRIDFATCARCALRRGQQDQAEMREQLERQMKRKAVAV